jgi:hypothetical protein
MRNLFTTAMLVAYQAIVDAKQIIMPPTITTGQDIAIVWIHGASCDNEAY